MSVSRWTDCDSIDQAPVIWILLCVRLDLGVGCLQPLQVVQVYLEPEALPSLLVDLGTLTRLFCRLAQHVHGRHAHCRNDQDITMPQLCCTPCNRTMELLRGHLIVTAFVGFNACSIVRVVCGKHRLKCRYEKRAIEQECCTA